MVSRGMSEIVAVFFGVTLANSSTVFFGVFENSTVL